MQAGEPGGLALDRAGGEGSLDQTQTFGTDLPTTLSPQGPARAETGAAWSGIGRQGDLGNGGDQGTW